MTPIYTDKTKLAKLPPVIDFQEHPNPITFKNASIIQHDGFMRRSHYQ